MSISQVAVDASFLLKLLLPEASSDLVEKKWKGWIENSVEVIAPTLIMFEASSVLRNRVFRGTLASAEASELIDRMRHIDLSLIYEPELLDLAWEIGTMLKVSTLYDCFYLAVAKLFNVPFWTADKRLHKSAKREFPLINAI